MATNYYTESQIRAIASVNNLATREYRASDTGKTLRIRAGLTGADAEVVGSGATGKTVYLSSACISDTNLALDGTTTGEDQSALIQPILDLALTATLRVIWDVAVTAKNLVVHSNTSIEVSPGCGAKLADDANVPILQNANCKALAYQVGGYDSPDWEAIEKDENICIIGGIWHGNPESQEHDTAEEGWNVPIRLFNIRHLEFRPAAIYKPRTFACHFANISDSVIAPAVIDVGTAEGYNYDGIHINGPASNLDISCGSGRSMDDLLGLCADDLDSQAGGTGRGVLAPFAAGGDMTDIRVSQLHLNNSGIEGIRILSGTSRVDRVMIRNVTGKNAGPHLKIDNYAEAPERVHFSGPGNIGTVTIEGWDIESSNYSSGGHVAYRGGIFVSADVEKLILRNCTFRPAAGATSAPIVIHNSGAEESAGTLDLLKLDNVLVDAPATEGTNFGEVVLVSGSASVGRIEVTNFTRRANASDPFVRSSFVRTMNTATVGSLVVNGISAPELVALESVDGGAISQVEVTSSDVSFFQRGDQVSLRQVVRDGPGRYRIHHAAILGEAFGPVSGKFVDASFAVTLSASSWADAMSAYIGLRTPSYDYAVAVNRPGYMIGIVAGSVKLMKNVAGTVTDLATATTTISANRLYRVEIRAVGTSIKGYVYDLLDGTWLQSAGAWSAAKTPFAAVTDSSLAAAGHCFVQRYLPDSDGRDLVLSDPVFEAVTY